MKQVNMYEAKTHLSSLVRQAAGGEPFVIAISGKPQVRVIPYADKYDGAGRIGFLKGNIAVPSDFDEMGKNAIAAMFGL